MGISHELIRPLTLALTGAAVPFDPDLLWDDERTTDVVETREAILLKALERGGREIASWLGDSSEGWRWGRVHTLTLSHDLAQLDSKMAHGPFANDGGLFTVDVANPSARAKGKTFGHGAGASMRMVVEADPAGMKTWLQLPGGQDLHRTGEHYNDLLPGWLRNEPFELPFRPDAVEEAAVDTLVVGP